MYTIIEARVEFTHNEITRVTVLVDMTGNQLRPLTDVRAIFATKKPMAGYMSIPAGTELSAGLLQDVAGFGQETVDRDEIFPSWKQKLATLKIGGRNHG